MTDQTIHAAFAQAYADMSNPKKNASNPAFKSKYANLEELLNVTRPHLTAVGLCLIQQPVSEDGRIGVETRIVHSSGSELDLGYYTVPLAKNDAQGAGSALTYCRRYAIAAIFGLAQEDDDGNAASQPTRAAQTPDTKPAGADTKSDGPTPSQLGKIRGLVRDLGYSDDQLHNTIRKRYGAEKLDDITKKQASELIDKLTSSKKPEPTAEEVAAQLGATVEGDYADEPIPF